MHKAKFNIFPIFRNYSYYFSVRAGSTYHEFGGTIHNVTGGFYHGSYNDSNYDYNVAVLQVYTDSDIE
jgi:hypothetical protein